MPETPLPAVDSPATTTLVAPPRLRYLRLAIGLPIIAIVWYFVGTSLKQSFQAIDWANLRVNWIFMAASLGSLIVGRLFTAMNCKQTLAAMGQQTRYRHVVPIIWVASMGRYIPGKMAVVAGSTVMLLRLGIRLSVVLAALLLGTALNILIGIVAAAPLFLTADIRHKIPGGWVVAGIMLVVGLVCLHPLVFTRLCNLLLKRLKRQPLPDRLQLPAYFRAIGITLLRLLSLGLALWFAARGLGAVSIASYPTALAAGGLASVAGFLAVFAPAGLGVHEAVYLLTLSTILGQPELGLLVVLVRFFNLLSDAITGGIGMIMMKGVG